LTTSANLTPTQKESLKNILSAKGLSLSELEDKEGVDMEVKLILDQLVENNKLKSELQNQDIPSDQLSHLPRIID